MIRTTITAAIAVWMLVNTASAQDFNPHDNNYEDDYAALKRDDPKADYLLWSRLGETAVICADLRGDWPTEWPGSYWDDLASLAFKEAGGYENQQLSIDASDARALVWEWFEDDAIYFAKQHCPDAIEPEFKG